MLRFAQRRAVERMLQLLRTAGAEPRLFFALAADSVLRQEIADTLTADGSIQQIPTLITPGDPVSRAIREHQGSHGNTKLFVVDGLSEAIWRGGEGFFSLLAQSAGYYTNYGTWCLIWLTDPESRLRLERESARLFQAATYNPTFFSLSLLEPRPGSLPTLAVPPPEAGDPDGRLCALAAKIRHQGESADRVELADELLRLGEKEGAEVLFHSVFHKDPQDPWRVRAARGLYRLGRLSLDEVRREVGKISGEALPEALLLQGDLEESAGDYSSAEVSLRKALSLVQGELQNQARLALARLLRRRSRLKEARDLLAPALPPPDAGARGREEAQAATWAAPLLAEAARVELDLAFGEGESPSSEHLQKIRRDLERARALALTGRPEDHQTAHFADTNLAGLLFATGEEDAALALLEKIIRRAEQAGMKTLALDGYRLRMSALFDLGENSQAMGDLMTAVRLAKTIGYPDLEAEVLREQADVEEKLGNLDKAAKLRGEAEVLRSI